MTSKNPYPNSGQKPVNQLFPAQYKCSHWTECSIYL